MINLNKALKFSQNLALKAGKLLLEKQSEVKIVKQKDLVDIATNADLEAEKLIINAIQKQYSDHNIISEEKGALNKKSDYTWYVDPLDCTKEYLRQIPDYSTCMCLFYKKEPLLSTVNLPYSNQLFSAGLGVGAFLNNKKIKVNQKKEPRQSIIYLYPPRFDGISEEFFEKNMKILSILIKEFYRVRCTASQNKFLCFLALGSIEAHLNFSFPVKQLADSVPGLFIAQMAGAKITDLKGNELDFCKAHQLFLASNGKLHHKLLKLIKY